MGDSEGIPLPHHRRLRENLPASREWQAELSISRLFRTSIRLQTAFDRCFSQFGLTAQEAAVLLHCSEDGETSAGKLAGRRWGETKARSRALLTGSKRAVSFREGDDPRDHRLLIIRATGRGERVAPQLKARFEEVRSQFFEGVLNVDIDKLETVLSQLHANAERLCEGKAHKDAQG